MFPGYGEAASVGHGAGEPEDLYVRLRSVAPDEARSLCIRLESEGIPCSAELEGASADALPDQTRVAILVRETDVGAANEILSLPQAAEEEDEDDEEKRLVDNWICPACRRRELVALPLSKNWRSVQLGCITVVAVPIIVTFLLRMFPSPAIDEDLSRLANRWAWAWILCILATAVLVVFAPRDKRCKACGWKSARPATTDKNAKGR